jgi:diguanylate cyclase (GGDEF)-like protein
MDLINDALVVLSDLIKNGILLFGLGFIYAATNFEQNSSKLRYRIGLGVALGLIAVLIMMYPWRLEEGLFFDTRNVLYSVIGLFFGGITTVVAAAIGIIYRIGRGGSGVYAGVLTIITTSLLGYFWPHIRKIFKKIKSEYIEYYMLGLFSTIITLLCFFAIPNDPLRVIERTVIPFMLLYPILTMILAKIVHNQSERLAALQKIKNQQLLLQASIDATKAMEVFALDSEYRYLSFNEFHFYSMKSYYDIEIEKGHNFLDYIVHPKMKQRIKENLDVALLGQSYNQIAEIESVTGKYVEEQYSPITNEKGTVIGVTVFSQDISERKKYEQSILYLSYRDPLTNLHNRRYYTEEIQRLDQDKYYPLSVISADINGLKIMNDAFGHDAGDLLLCTVADELVKSFRNESRIARIGGDEFIIMLPNTSREKALQMITEAKHSIELNLIHGMSISVSFGVSTKISSELVQDTLKAAENDMYSHKLFEISSHRSETIKTILNTLHEKNPREEKHSARVSLICTKIGTEMKMSKEEISMLKAISNLHDIGKIAIDEAILNKPGKLDDHEWEAIKRHPEIGYRILTASAEYKDIAEDILSHHERYDGKGYPRGLSGENIPIRARIISIADAYDAMISERPYRKPFSHEQAIAEISRCTGTQFDPNIANIFIKLFQHERIQ